MPDLNLQADPTMAAARPQRQHPPLQPELWDDGHAVIQSLGTLNHAIASWHWRLHQGRSRVIVRFHNGYGAIISEYHRREGIYEIAPLRFRGPEGDDYEFYFGSHVADLTWCSDRDELVRVCQQIARLLPPMAI
jgi:hypothetical protein